MTIERKKCSMHEQCICDASADECIIRKQSYNKAIEDMVSSLIRNSSTEAINGNVTLVVTDKRIKFIAEQLKKANMKIEKKKQCRTIVEQEAINRLSFIREALFGGVKLEIVPNEENIKLMDAAIEALENIIEIKNHKITLLDLENYMKFEDECVKKNFTLKSLLEAREKQIVKKPILKTGVEVIHVNREKGPHELTKSKYQDWTCPTCGCFVGQRYNSTQLTHDQRKHKFCSECGQRIDWSEKGGSR